MAESLEELVVKIKTDASELEKGLTDAEHKTEVSSRRMADSLKKIGIGMVASSAAITAALGLMGKAAIEEDVNIKRLSTTMKNAGMSYDSVKDSLEAVIAATQRKTGVADNEQRDILNRLILVTKDYNKALSLLPTALDLAAAGGMDAATAATYLGKAYLELEQGAESVSVRFGQASLQFKSMEDIQNRVAGAAENMANPFSVLKATMGDLAETIGSNLIPVIKGTIDKIVDISIKAQDWVKANPELARTITLIAGALATFLGVAGTALLLIPKLKLAWMALNLVFTASPIGLIITAIGLLIAVGILLWQNWDKVSHFFADMWSNMKQIVLTAVDKMLAYLEKFVGWIPALRNKIESARASIRGMIDAEKVGRDAADVERTAKGMTGTIKSELEKQKSDAIANYNSQKAAALALYESNKQKIKEEYGVYQSSAKDKQSLAKATSEVAKRALDEELKQARKAHDEKMDLLDREYNQKIRTLNAEADYQIKIIQDQIDRIDEQTESEELARERAEEQKKIAELKAAGDKVALEEYLAEVARKELLRKREEEKKALRDKIDDIRTETQTEIDRLAAELEAQKSTLEQEWVLFENNQQLKSEALDLALETELKRLDDERIAKELLEQQKLTATLNTIAGEEAAITASFDARLTEASIYQAALEATLRDITQTVTVNYVSGSNDTTGLPGGAGGHGDNAPIPEFASGGVVPGAIGQPQLALVHGGETVIPANESVGGSIVLNFTQPLFFEREDQMNQFVDKISKTLDRKYRLNGRL